MPQAGQSSERPASPGALAAPELWARAAAAAQPAAAVPLEAPVPARRAAGWNGRSPPQPPSPLLPRPRPR
ncbi:MAG TPA: hypothetical protein VN908_00565 [Gemmatimonadales bacterium]|nr:hypothetical protein [Gemmatimonadales bacterium]